MSIFMSVTERRNLIRKKISFGFGTNLIRYIIILSEK